MFVSLLSKMLLKLSAVMVVASLFADVHF